MMEVDLIMNPPLTYNYASDFTRDGTIETYDNSNKWNKIINDFIGDLNNGRDTNYEECSHQNSRKFSIKELR